MKNKKRKRYTEGPIGKIKIVEDFLPPPEKLMLKQRNVKVTINLKESSIDFFKKEAVKQKTQYQKIIRELLDHYASRLAKA